MSERRLFLPKQLAFIRSAAPNVLYSGAVRAGKTYAGCTKAVLRACTPGSREAIVRKHRTTLTSTTLVTLLQGDGLNPPVLPPNTYEHNKVEGVIRLNGGGEIVYFGLDDVNKIGSRSLSGVFVDETVEITERDWEMLQTRVSIELPGLPMQVYGACNPGAPGHFLARMFGLAAGHTAWAGYEAYRTRSEENVFLSRDYLDRINKLTGVARKRLVLGEWVGAEGLVYDNWNRDVHVQELPPPGDVVWVRAAIGVDYGFSHPFAACLVLVDSDGRAHVAAEAYKSGMSEQAIVSEVDRLAKLSGMRQLVRVFVDPAAPGIRAAIHKGGLATAAADNDVASGIMTVRQRLEPAGDGRPRLTVAPTCGNLIREMETYEYDRAKSTGLAKDVPKKENDDACFDGATRVAIQGRGWVRIDSVRAGERVLTPLGFEPVLGAGQTGTRTVVEFEFESGNRVTCTPDHRFLTDEYRYASLCLEHDRRSGASQGDATGLERHELVPVRAVLLPSAATRGEGLAAPGGMGSGERADSRWLPRAPLERGPIGQPVGEPRNPARRGPSADAHDAGASRGSSKERCREGGPRRPRVARIRCGARVARGAWGRSLGEATLSVARVRGLRRDVRDTREREARAVHLLEQLQDAPIPRPEPRTDAAVRARSAGTREVFCIATPSRCFVIEGGLIARNCDALRYALMSLRRTSLAIA